MNKFKILFAGLHNWVRKRIAETFRNTFIKMSYFKARCGVSSPNFARKRQIFGMQSLFDPVKTGLHKQKVFFCLNIRLVIISTQRLKTIWNWKD